MNRSADIMNTFSVGELARRTAVTVRTLHHYESLGLLVPSARTEAGHRRYGAPDVVRLRRIVALKGLGVRLREIAGLLEAPPGGLLDALRAQRAALVEQRAELDAAIERIDALERNVRAGDGALSDGDLNALMETIAMEQQQQWGRRYLTEVRGMSEAEAEAHMASTPPEHLEGTRTWAELIGDVESAIASGVEPQSAAGRALAQRWRDLIGAFTGGSGAKLGEIKQFYAELPSGFPKPYSNEVEAFIHIAGPCE